MTDWQILVGIAAFVVGVVLVIRGRRKKPPIITPEKKEETKRQTDIVVTAPTTPQEETVTIAKDGKKQKGRLVRMPQGLQVFDKNGNITLDLTDRLTRGIALVEVKQNNSISIKDGSAKVVYTKIASDYTTHVEQLVRLDIEVSFTEGRKVWAAISGGILGQRFYTAINIKKIKNGLAEISIIDNGGIVEIGADRAFIFIGEV